MLKVHVHVKLFKLLEVKQTFINYINFLTNIKVHWFFWLIDFTIEKVLTKILWIITLINKELLNPIAKGKPLINYSGLIINFGIMPNI